jgi:hypothetical protein
MLRTAIIAATALTLFASPSFAAKPCHGPNGKFIKCPAAKAAPAAKCRNAKGHFAKCGTAGAKPA